MVCKRLVSQLSVYLLNKENNVGDQAQAGGERQGRRVGWLLGLFSHEVSSSAESKRQGLRASQRSEGVKCLLQGERR